jgi:hypothetical protein
MQTHAAREQTLNQNEKENDDMQHPRGRLRQHPGNESRSPHDVANTSSLFRHLEEECDGWVRELRAILPIQHHPLTVRPSGAGRKVDLEKHR